MKSTILSDLEILFLLYSLPSYLPEIGTPCRGANFRALEQHILPNSWRSARMLDLSRWRLWSIIGDSPIVNPHSGGQGCTLRTISYHIWLRVCLQVELAVSEYHLTLMPREKLLPGILAIMYDMVEGRGSAPFRVQITGQAFKSFTHQGLEPLSSGRKWLAFSVCARKFITIIIISNEPGSLLRIRIKSSYFIIVALLSIQKFPLFTAEFKLHWVQLRSVDQIIDWLRTCSGNMW